MSSPYQYFGRRSHMSAVLKKDAHRVRSARGDLFKTVRVRHSSMDGDGKVTVVETKDVRATPISGRARHALSLKKERH